MGGTNTFNIHFKPDSQGVYVGTSRPKFARVVMDSSKKEVFEFPESILTKHRAFSRGDTVAMRFGPLKGMPGVVVGPGSKGLQRVVMDHVNACVREYRDADIELVNSKTEHIKFPRHEWDVLMAELEEFKLQAGELHERMEAVFLEFNTPTHEGLVKQGEKGEPANEGDEPAKKKAKK